MKTNKKGISMTFTNTGTEENPQFIADSPILDNNPNIKMIDGERWYICPICGEHLFVVYIMYAANKWPHICEHCGSYIEITA